jgi:hypothetical protein
MYKELDDQLCKAFPNLYKDRYASMQGTCMCWGFSCGEGWFKIIYDLSEKLEAEILKLPPEERPYCCASQVKEKYGTLRFYLSASTDEMEKLISEACKKSARTCEECGKRGCVRVDGGWYFTACKKHSRGAPKAWTWWDRLKFKLGRWCLHWGE